MFKMFSAPNYPINDFNLEDRIQKFVSRSEVVITHISQSSGKVNSVYVTTVTLAYHPRSTLVHSMKPGGSRVRVFSGTRSYVENKLEKLVIPEVCHMAQSEYYQDTESCMVMTVIY